MPIWGKEGGSELDLMTLNRVWLALNYSNTLDKRPEEYKYVLKNTNTSRFKNLITKDVYTVYQRVLHQPLSLGGRKPSDRSDEEHENINDADISVFKQKCK